MYSLVWKEELGVLDQTQTKNNAELFFRSEIARLVLVFFVFGTSSGARVRFTYSLVFYFFVRITLKARDHAVCRKRNNNENFVNKK